MSARKRKERLISPKYRTLLGERLKEKRISLNLTRSDISLMTTIAENTINNIEKGTTTNIDYYVEYAKSVQYPLETLNDFKIKLIPINKLPKERQLTSSLTSKIREHIVNSKFLKGGKEVAEIREELLRKKLIDESVDSTAIAGVMRNLLNDEVMKAKKSGRKNLYWK